MIAIYPPQLDVPEQDREWSVWTEPDQGNHDGRCVGFGATRKDALIEAAQELSRDWMEVVAAITETNLKP